MPTSTPGVYVVDDDHDIRESLRTLLEEEGYRVEEAADGLGALAFLEATHLPWVVLLDRMMPRLDGLEVLRRLAEQPQMRARLAIIYLTARQTTRDEETQRLLSAYAFATVTKPFDLERLLAVVEKASKHLAARQ